MEIDAAEHDRVTSQISHFPTSLASGLMEQAADYAGSRDDQSLCGWGFRDMTRIAESEPGMWASILMTNGPKLFWIVLKISKNVWTCGRLDKG